MNASATPPEAPSPRRRSPARRLLRGIVISALVLVALLLVALGVIWHQLRASLALLDGQTGLAGIAATVVVERDALGVPTIRATNRLDALRALGFVHAQERFFQMDLLRRRGAGELAELFGPALVEHDESVRRHDFRATARASLARLAPEERIALEAYVAGVNAGLAALGARPPEYFLLQSQPAPWRPEDSILVGSAMFLTLQDADGSENLRREAVARALPPAAARFFFPAASEWDAALDGSTLPFPPIPGPEVISFAPNTAAVIPSEPAVQAAEPALKPGSNSWGVQGAASATGAAIVANDMHLDLGMPNIWFRACLAWPEAGGTRRRLIGVTLPGIPGLIVGSNGDIAWCFTNATIDNSDIVDVDLDPANPLTRYRTPQGMREFEVVEGAIAVRGAASRTVRFQKTIWGPVIGKAGAERCRVLLWTPQLPDGANLAQLALDSARTVAEAIPIAQRCGNPVQNLLIGDRSGALAYTLMGRVPDRRGFDGAMPTAFSDGKARWNGWLSPAATPRILAPAGGRLWTANNRILGTPEYLALGAEDTDLGARAHQIRDDLLALPAPVRETDLLTIHRDDRALFLMRWQQVMLRVLEGAAPDTNSTRWIAARDAVRNWGGRAATDSVGYRLVRGFHFGVIRRLMEPVVERCEAVQRGLNFQVERQEGPAWALLEARPAHLLNPRFRSYDELLVDAVKGLFGELERQNLAVTNATWGARNTVRIGHPISRGVPALGRWLDLAPVQLPGDDHMPRVQGSGFGPSERLVVSPGHEERGLFHMPGGQSGHFLSPFYRAGHDAWVKVEPTPLLPGPTLHTLRLEPSIGR